MERIQSFKKVGYGAGARRARHDDAAAVRKADKDTFISHKRMLDRDPEPQGVTKPVDTRLMGVLVASAVAAIKSDCVNDVADGINDLRKLLRRERAPIQSAVDAGVAPRLVVLLDQDEHAEIKNNACWTIANFALGTSTQVSVLVDAGVVPALIRAVGTTSIRRVALGALSNIAAGSVTARDQAIAALPTVLHIIENPEDNHSSTTECAYRLLMNLCHLSPAPPREVLMAGVRAFTWGVSSAHDMVAMLSCWGLSFVAEAGLEFIHEIIITGCVPRLVEMLSIRRELFTNHVLRVLGSMAAGTDASTKAIVDAGVLAKAPALLQRGHVNTDREVCWMVSNILASGHVQAVCDSGILLPMVSLLASTSSERVKVEILYSLVNITADENAEHLETLARCNFIRPVCELLSSPSVHLLRLSLDIITLVLQRDAGYAADVEAHGGADMITLQTIHQDDEVAEKASALTDTYFSHIG